MLKETGIDAPSPIGHWLLASHSITPLLHHSISPLTSEHKVQAHDVAALPGQFHIGVQWVQMVVLTGQVQDAEHQLGVPVQETIADVEVFLDEAVTGLAGLGVNLVIPGGIRPRE